MKKSMYFIAPLKTILRQRAIKNRYLNPLSTCYAESWTCINEGLIYLCSFVVRFLSNGVPSADSRGELLNFTSRVSYSSKGEINCGSSNSTLIVRVLPENCCAVQERFMFSFDFSSCETNMSKFDSFNKLRFLICIRSLNSTIIIPRELNETTLA